MTEPATDDWLLKSFCVALDDVPVDRMFTHKRSLFVLSAILELWSCQNSISNTTILVKR